MKLFTPKDFNLGADVGFVEVTTAALLANKRAKELEDRYKILIHTLEGIKLTTTNVLKELELLGQVED